MTSKSPQLSTSECKDYTHLMVLRSEAGYYIGSLFIESPNEMYPGTRDSEYFKTEDQAKLALSSNEWIQRY